MVWTPQSAQRRVYLIDKASSRGLTPSEARELRLLDEALREAQAPLIDETETLEGTPVVAKARVMRWVAPHAGCIKGFYSFPRVGVTHVYVNRSLVFSMTGKKDALRDAVAKSLTLFTITVQSGDVIEFQLDSVTFPKRAILEIQLLAQKGE